MSLVLATLYVALALKIWSSDWSWESLVLGFAWPLACAFLLSTSVPKKRRGA